MKPILVIRLSSLGDVALTVPVFRTLEREMPGRQFIFVSQPAFADLFTTLGNVRFFPADISGRNDGLAGMLRLYRQLREVEFGEVIDLHNVFRSNLLTTSFKLRGIPATVYDKKRSDKNAFIADPGRPAAIPHTSEAYLAAFSHLRSDMRLRPGPCLFPAPVRLAGDRNICVAPFSRHPSKEWTHGHMADLIGMLIREGLTVYCTAFGDREQSIADVWQETYPDLKIMDNTMTLAAQLAYLRSMDLVISMDSANLHLAGLVGTPVVSIWGPTHPALGFGPLNGDAGVIQPPAAYTGRRPLSRYGRLGSEQEKKDSEAALSSIRPELVFSRVCELLEKAGV